MGWRQALGESTGGINFGDNIRYFLANVPGYSFTGWFNLDNTDNQGLFDVVRGSISASSRLEVRIEGNDFKIYSRDIDNGTQISWQTTLAATTGMQHISVVCDLSADTIKIYLNGEQGDILTSAGYVASVSDNTAPYYAIIGCNDSATGNTDYTKGAIHDYRLYGRVLSANEIQTIYACRGNDSIINGVEIVLKAIGIETTTVTDSNVIELGPNLYDPIGVYGNLTFESDNLSFRRRV